jgi:hypothetical protein
MRHSGEESSPVPSQALKVSFQEAMANILSAISPKRTAQSEDAPKAQEPKSVEPKSPGPPSGEAKPEELKSVEPKAAGLRSEEGPEEPKSVEPKSAGPPSEEARPQEPKSVEPKSAEPRSEEAKSQATGDEPRDTAAAPAPYDIAAAMAEVAGAIAAKASSTAKAVAPAPVAAKPVAPEPAPPPTNDWQPVAIAPMDRVVQVGVTSKNGVLAVFFPCRLTANGWINALVRAPLLHEPTCWREWRDYYFDAN